MKAYDIIQQLYRVMPKLTSLFSTDVPITSLTKSGALVTAVTSSAHGLSSGDYIYITGANWQTNIASITRVGNIATVVCSSPHDLTEVFFETVRLIGSNEAEFNGTFKLLSVPNRSTFTIQVVDSGATSATGSPILLEPWRIGFNGWVPITVTSSTTFTYQSSGSASATAYGQLVGRKAPRISGAASLERAEAAYTRMGSNELWAFVVMGKVSASKSKYTQSDFISSSTATTVFRQSLINDVYVYVFVPTSSSLAARAERDLMSDVARYLFKSLLGKVYPTYFIDAPTTVMHFLQHQQLSYKGAYYIHEFQFEGAADITTNDIVENDSTRAFRDLNIDFKNDFDVSIVETLINLDDQPIE